MDLAVCCRLASCWLHLSPTQLWLCVYNPPGCHSRQWAYVPEDSFHCKLAFPAHKLLCFLRELFVCSRCLALPTLASLWSLSLPFWILVVNTWPNSRVESLESHVNYIPSGSTTSLWKTVVSVTRICVKTREMVLFVLLQILFRQHWEITRKEKKLMWVCSTF